MYRSSRRVSPGTSSVRLIYLDHCRRRKPECVEDVHAGILRRPNLSLPGESLCECWKALRKPEYHFILVLPRREGIYDRKAGNPYHPHAAHDGELFHAIDFLPGALPAPAALRRQILDHEYRWLVMRQEIVYLAKQTASFCGYDPLAPIYEKCRSFEDGKGEAP